jgi:peptidyl-prolyl cis-trans isomerase D
MQSQNKTVVRLLCALTALALLAAACKPNNLSTPVSVQAKATATSSATYVATVNGVQISVDAYQKLVRYYRYSWVNRYQQMQTYAQMFASDPQTSTSIQQQLDQIVSMLNDSQGLGDAVVNALVDTQLVRQEAARRGITITPAEVDKSLQEAFGYYPQGTPTPLPSPTLENTATPAATPATTQAAGPTVTLEPTPTVGPTETPGPTATPFTAESYAQQVQTFIQGITQATNLTEQDLRGIIEDSLYRVKLAEAIGADVPTEELQIHARHILVADEATAKDILAKLQAGEDWNALAAASSTDTATAPNGGDLGWFGKGVMDTTFEDAAFATAVGSISAPIQTQFGWHIIQVLESGNHPLAADAITQAKDTKLQDWLTSQRTVNGADGKPIIVILDNWLALTPDTPKLP